MAKWGLIFLVAFLMAHRAAARILPADDNAGLTDQKNFVSFGGVGSYSGVGNGGLPFGGAVGGVGTSGDVGGTNGFNGVGGVIGTGPNGGLGGLGGGGVIPGTGLGGLGGAGAIPGGLGSLGGFGGGAGGGAGVLPYP
ncbi:hypothetical protein OROGR_002747 [Orobanche gracilis]